MSTARSARQKLETESPKKQAEMSSSRRQLRQQKILKKDSAAASLVDVYACPELGEYISLKAFDRILSYINTNNNEFLTILHTSFSVL